MNVVFSAACVARPAQGFTIAWIQEFGSALVFAALWWKQAKARS